MKENNIIDIKNPAEDCLTQILRESAQKMLQVMIEQEAAEFVARYEAERLETGHRRVIRNGYLPKRNIQTGIGNVTVKMPRVRDKKPTSDKIEFYLSPNILSSYVIDIQSFLKRASDFELISDNSH